MPESILSDNDIMIIFASAPAGLGHLRVTKALAQGLPNDVTPILLGAHDPSLTLSHRIMSIHPIFRSVMEWAQNGKPEEFFTVAYRKLLRSQTKEIFMQTLELLKQRITVPKTVCIVATHFGLAHQYAQIKHELEKQTGTRFYIFVQVTDDSPQHMWYVPGVDITFVPSHLTKRKLEQYAQLLQYPKTRFIVIPYPISPALSKTNPLFYEHRYKQLKQESNEPIHVAIPISGAAVGLQYTDSLISLLHGKNGNCVFHIVAKTTPFTSFFLSRMEHTPHVRVYTSSHDRATVDAYETLYERIPIALEITKPSEQAFKALMNPKQTGGSILLFTRPVGRQEWDNVNFLQRHGLLPSENHHQILYHASENKIKEIPVAPSEINHWRSIRIPDDPKKAAVFILWLKKSGIFEHMVMYKKISSPEHPSDEVADTGVFQFWDKISEFLSLQKK